MEPCATWRLARLQKLEVERGDPSLSAIVMLEYSVTLLCVADGVRVTIGCTFGNKQLTFEDSSTIAVRL
jgi:formylmethanofuran dehydrogenase subunit E